MAVVTKRSLTLCFLFMATVILQTVTSKQKVVIMRRRNLTDIPNSRICHKCESLDLSENSIPRLVKDCFLQYSTVKYLYLRQNAIHEIDVHSLSGLNSLIILDISSNDITSIDKESFKMTPNLRRLLLNKNPLESVTFKSESLTSLDLSNCLLNTLTPESFSELPNLESVELRHNLLQVMSSDIAESLARIPRIYLGNNPWICDCSMVHLQTRTSNRDLFCMTEHDTILWSQVTCFNDSLLLVSTLPTIRTTPHLKVSMKVTTEHPTTFSPAELRNTTDTVVLASFDDQQLVYDVIKYAQYSMMLLVLVVLVVVSAILTRPELHSLYKRRYDDGD